MDRAGKTRSRRGPIWLLGAAAVVLGSVGGVFAFRRQSQSPPPDTSGCCDPATAGGDPIRCVQEPWRERTCDEACERDLVCAATRVLRMATTTHPDRSRRDEAASLIAAHWTDEESIDLLLSSGAWEALVAAGPEGIAAPGPWVWASLVAGRLDQIPAFAGALHAIESKPRSEFDSAHPCALRHDVLVCLAGQPQQGIELLARSSCGDAMRSYPETERVRRLGMLACGATTARWESEGPGDQEHMGARILSVAAHGGPARGRAPGEPIAPGSFMGDRVGEGALQIVAQGFQLSTAIAILADVQDGAGSPSMDFPLNAPLTVPRPPCHTNDPYHQQLCHLPAALLDQAADVLADEAERAPTTLAAGQLPRLQRPRDGAIHDEIRSDPKTFLQRKAWKMRLLAAAEWLRRGRVDSCRQVLKKIGGPPHAGWDLPVLRLQLAAGELDAVLATTERELAVPDVAVGRRAMLLTYRALALAQQGSFGPAYEAIRAATEAIDEVHPPADYFRPSYLTRHRLVWLRAALAWKTGHADDTLPSPKIPSEDRDGLHAKRAASLARWWDAVKAGEAEREAQRPELEVVDDPVDLVTPAAMYLVGEVARGSGDVEIWLDRAFYQRTLYGGRAAMRARAQAARWRGDQVAAKTWEERAAKLDALVKDENAAVLAAIADL